jgi:hypothetical protein
MQSKRSSGRRVRNDRTIIELKFAPHLFVSSASFLGDSEAGAENEKILDTSGGDRLGNANGSLIFSQFDRQGYVLKS